MEPSKKYLAGSVTDVASPVAGALAITMVVDVPPTSTTYGWLLDTSLLVTSVLAGGAPTAAGWFSTGMYVGVALSSAGVLVSLALASVGVVPSVAVAVVDEDARREEEGPG